MDAHELVQLAAIVAKHSSLLIHSNQAFPEAAIERYWVACKCRQDGWGIALKQFSSERQDLNGSSDQPSDWIQPFLEEVLTSEALSRVWAAVSTLADAHRGTAAASPIAQNILAGHLEARNRVLNLMVYGYGLGVEEAVALNRLRLRNERWTDTLLSLIGPTAGRAEWAFQPRAVRRLANSLRQHDTSLGRSVAKSLLLGTLATAYQRPQSHRAPHAELNRRIACSIIACLPPYVFDGTGQLTSSRHLWLLQSSADTQGRIDLAARPSLKLSEDGWISEPPTSSEDSFRRFDLR